MSTILLSAENFKGNYPYIETELFILRNKEGAEVALTNYGARIVSAFVPDKTGTFTDVILGFDNINGYLNASEPYYGASIGRYCNRIANAKFLLEEQQYLLQNNSKGHCLHGGKKGFHDRVWHVWQPSAAAVEFTNVFPALEEGFPGQLHVKISYTLSDENDITISYEAVTDKTTVINLTNHAYFNLNGAGSGVITDHTLQIMASHYTPVDATLIPTGQIEMVENTPFDFRVPVRIGERISDANQQLLFGKGYDHNFVLDHRDATVPQLAAIAAGDKSGIVLKVYTTEPGIQFYSGNFMASENVMKGGAPDDFRTAFCLETQHFPDSPNQPSFPSVVLKPEDIFKSVTVYSFSTA